MRALSREPIQSLSLVGRALVARQLGDPPPLYVRDPIHSATSAQDPTGSGRGVALIP